jgi:tRNA threonylcarbamoyl adenosine modification protein YeaZ
MVNAAIHDIVHLAIETTGRAGSIAVMQGPKVLRAVNLDASMRTAAALAPCVDQAIESCRRQGTPIAMISVANGPGSFTGLRIGVTTAKTLSYALRLPLLAIDSLSSIAAAAFVTNPSVATVCVAIDAYRGQVYCGLFQRRDLLPELNPTLFSLDAHRQVPPLPASEPPAIEVLDRGQWSERLETLPEELHFAGDAKPLAARSARLIARDCDAVGTGLLALRAVAVEPFIDPLSLVPRYLKLSAAEENWLPD